MEVCVHESKGFGVCICRRLHRVDMYVQKGTHTHTHRSLSTT